MRYAALLTSGLAFVAWADVSCGGEAPAEAGGGAGDRGEPASAAAGEGGSAAGAAGAAGRAAGGGGAAGAGARLAYNRVQQKSSHNSYERQEAVFDQLVFHRLRSLEFDVHAARDDEPALAGDWYVYHFDLPGYTPPTNCTKLSDCLDELAAFHAAVPGHEVATIFVDLKGDFAPNHTADQLDQLLASALPAGAVFTPSDLLAACPGAADLRAAVGAGCGWPALEALRGKFVFALTGGDTCAPASKLSAYAGPAPGERIAFVAPEITAGCPWSRLAEDRASVFVNMKSGPASDGGAAAVRGAGLVGRVYDLNDEASWARARDAGAHVLATDKVNARLDPWADTAADPAWPFACPGGCAPAPPGEASAPIGLRVRSGDVGGASDSFLFVYDAPAGGADVSWAAYVSTPNSHVEPLAKGCLMARGSAAPGARYFAVCRPADGHRIRVQFRDVDGGPTEVVADVPLAPENAVPHDSVAFVRLELAAAPDGGVTATGSASRDGAAWARVASRDFDAPLPLQGLAASGRGDPNAVTFYFGQVVRTAGAESRALAEADFAARAPVGGATGASAQGYLP